MFGKVTRLLNRWGSVDVLWPGCTWYYRRGWTWLIFHPTCWEESILMDHIFHTLELKLNILPSSWVLGERHVLNFPFPSAESETEDQKQSFWHALCGRSRMRSWNLELRLCDLMQWDDAVVYWPMIPYGYLSLQIGSRWALGKKLLQQTCRIGLHK